MSDAPPPFCLDVFLLVTAFTLGAGWFAWRFLENTIQRLFLGSCLGCIYLWCGIGAAYEPVPWSYRTVYLVFTGSLVLAFLATLQASRSAAASLCAYIKPMIVGATTGRVFVFGAIGIYLLARLMPLIYPEFNLPRLISPPSPDCSAWLEREASLVYEGQGFGITRVYDYVATLSYPFFLIALYQLRHQYVALALLLILPEYFAYCVTSYANRGTAFALLVTFGLTVWLDNPKARFKVLAGGLLALPLLAVGFYEYSQIRIGGNVSDISWDEALSSMVQQEISFPLDAQTVIESDQRVDLPAYFTWLATLPVPKVLTGRIEGARVNYEISWLLLRKDVGTEGGYVLLTGLVTESVYIYGNTFFWLHAVFLGCLIALFCRLIEGHPRLLLVGISAMLLFSYSLSRAGISGTMANVINQHLLLCAWFVYLAIRPHFLAQSQANVRRGEPRCFPGGPHRPAMGRASPPQGVSKPVVSRVQRTP
jgi:hypothetical protein